MNHVGIAHGIFGPDGLPTPSADLVEVARGIAGNHLLLSISGRDSLAMWLYLREQGFRLTPYFCYTVPGLSYDNQWLDYLESYFGTHIIRLPHPRTYELLRSYSYMPAHTAALVANMRLVRYEYADIEGYLAEQLGLGPNYLTAVGIKAADNLMRLRMIRQLGPIGLKRRRYYYAIWDWKTAEVKAYLAKHNAKLSRSYLYFGSTGDGVDYNFLKILKQRGLEEDYRKVLQLFPMAEIELFRYEGVR